MKILLIIVVILLIFGFLIIANENLRLNTWKNFYDFGNFYYSSLIESYNKGVEITGNIVKFFGN